MGMGLLSGLCGVLAETAKVLHIIQKAMASFTILTPAICCLLYLPFLLIEKQTRESLSSLEWIYLLAIVAPWSLMASATVAASAVAHSGCNNLPLHNLLLRTLTAWKIPVSTAALATLFCFFPFGAMFVSGSPLVLVLDLLFNKNRGGGVMAFEFDARSLILTILIVLGCSSVSFCFIMGFVVSVVEDKRGMEAIKKGRDLMKGTEMEMQGFVLNLVFALVGLMVYGGMRIINNKGVLYESEAIRVAMGLIVLSCFGVVGLIGVVACTILYINCKKIHGEEIQVLKSMNCGEEATQSLITQSA